MVFLQPHYLYLLLLLPVAAFLYIRYIAKMHASMVFSSITAKQENKYLYLVRTLPLAIRLITAGFIIVALADPQTTTSFKQTVPVPGIDLVLVSDASQSMLAEDLKPNRIEALKAVATRFVAQRQNDRIGLVIYAGESFTSCPLTTNHAQVVKHIQSMDQVPLTDGTAIGVGLATAVNRLKSSKAKSKVAILMTDGENNAGYISPVKATEIAITYGVKVYTIGIGTYGQAPYPVFDLSGQKQLIQVPVKIDTLLLKDIASKTGGLFFHANDNYALEKIYREINNLEKAEISQKEVVHYQSISKWVALPAFFLLLLEMLLRYTMFKTPL